MPKKFEPPWQLLMGHKARKAGKPFSRYHVREWQQGYLIGTASKKKRVGKTRSEEFRQVTK